MPHSTTPTLFAHASGTAQISFVNTFDGGAGIYSFTAKIYQNDVVTTDEAWEIRIVNLSVGTQYLVNITITSYLDDGASTGLTSIKAVSREGK